MDIMKKSVLLTLVSTIATQAVANRCSRILPRAKDARAQNGPIRLSQLERQSGVARNTITNMVKTTSSHGNASVSAYQAARVFNLAEKQSNAQAHIARMKAIRNRRNLTAGRNALYAAQAEPNLSQEKVMSIAGRLKARAEELLASTKYHADVMNKTIKDQYAGAANFAIARANEVQKLAGSSANELNAKIAELVDSANDIKNTAKREIYQDLLHQAFSSALSKAEKAALRVVEPGEPVTKESIAASLEKAKAAVISGFKKAREKKNEWDSNGNSDKANKSAMALLGAGAIFAPIAAKEITDKEAKIAEQATEAKKAEVAKLNAECDAAIVKRMDNEAEVANAQVNSECDAALEAQAEHGATVEAAKSDAGWHGLKGYKNRAAAWATGNADMALPKNQARQWNRMPGSSYANRGASWTWDHLPSWKRAQ